MRILLLTVGYPPNASGLHGSAIYVRNTGHALAARGNDVHVLDCTGVRHDSRVETDGGVTVHRARPMRARGLDRIRRVLPPRTRAALDTRRRTWVTERFQADRVMRRVINAYQYHRAFRGLGLQFDVVESPGMSLELFFGLLRPTPLVVHLHTPPGLELMFEQGHLSWRARVADEVDRFSARRADVLTSGSHMMVDALRDRGWLAADEPRVIPLTIDAAPWSVVPSVRDTAPVVLTVGRLDARKAPEVLVEGAARLREHIDDLEVVFVGHGGRPNEYRDRLVDLARQTGAPCRFEDQIPDEELMARYASARVVAIPSRSESFSLAGLEAMAAGRPVVCTSRVGLAELIEGTGAGTVVEPDDPVALAAGLRPYLEDRALAAEAGERARAVVTTRLAPARIAQEREVAYEEAIRRWHHRRGPR
jgi:glycosyltransferase involved in cell wall biosynthesis